MQGIVFWLIYPLLWFISILPFPVFYFFSDMVFVLVYHLIRYRRKTVTANLRLVFPEKSSEEIATIRKKFYRHMCDMFLEMIKSINISKKELKKRFTFTNLEALREMEKLDKSIIIMCGHYASYEWMLSLQLYGLKHKSFGIYKSIRNRYFDRLVKSIRSRFNAELISTYKASEFIRFNQESGQLGTYAMIADQSPKLERAKHWIDFMGIKAPVFEGSDRFARKLDMAVVYLHVEKFKRGYYEATFIPITSNAPKEPPHFITKKFIQLLEEQIKKAPEYYLWTHKRWKHKDQPISSHAEVID
ncbi:lipid A biosynthesis acyltransferase [Christiangramia fulva]|uniref:Lipid A biosynthesis acyltransferase n=1 Tax=Christiangramia fulva TaxID=2126553 RepID=A0A2R3Z9S3_9FLAO|nr:lipid A biosynthesis acyltransferase [Christiangramia fulva]AVR46932.1 lipid A biosynthesis acyltransferase [Christiangramia fulva]